MNPAMRRTAICGALAGLFTCSLQNCADFSLATGAVSLTYFTLLRLLVGRWSRAEARPAWLDFRKVLREPRDGEKIPEVKKTA